MLRVAGMAISARMCDLSLSGMRVRTGTARAIAPGDWIAVTIAGVGEVPAQVMRAARREMGLLFHLPACPVRDRMLVKIFTSGYDNTTQNDDALTITLRMVASIFRDQPAPAIAGPEVPAEAPPARLMAEIAERAHDIAAWDRDTLAELWEAQSASGGDKAA